MSGKVAVVDYGMGNLRSVWQALAHVAGGREIVVTADPAELRAAERVVFPGQGAMPDCMRELELRGLRRAVLDSEISLIAVGTPFDVAAIDLTFIRAAAGSTLPVP